MNEHQECGYPQNETYEPYEVVSRHITSEGVLVYTRCGCGALRLWLHRWGHDTRLVAESGRAGSPDASGQPALACCG